MRWLMTLDGARVRGMHLAENDSDIAVVMIHGFNASLTRPQNIRVINGFRNEFAVVAVELRGHGHSPGRSTLGGMEIMEVQAGVDWARTLGYRKVVTIGFSMGAMAVVRHAGVLDGVDAVVSVSAPAFHGYRGTPPMRMLAFGVEHPVGRFVVQHVFGTRMMGPPWPDPYPLHPAEAAEHIPPTPFLVLHGFDDAFFPDEHPEAIVRGAAIGAELAGVPDNTELWRAHYGHAEVALPQAVMRSIGFWIRGAVSAGADG
ncbi:MAG: alpha/beta fold hydrolase [Actinobacteria bacterium]|nr:alpha/beta fold hydrolase [Actinomycetota bacterium]